MSKQYAGICIGGPNAGQKIICQGQRLQTYIRVGTRRIQHENGYSPISVQMQTHEYYYQELGDFGLWIYQGMTPFEAIQALIDSYAVQHLTPRG